MTYIVAISAYLVLLTIFGLIVARKKVKTSQSQRRGGVRQRHVSAHLERHSSGPPLRLPGLAGAHRPQPLSGPLEAEPHRQTGRGRHGGAVGGAG